jgi:hypothetical protein
VEDIPAAPGQTFMPVAKFLSILRQVDRKVRLDYDARLTIEIGPPATPMQIFDVESVAGHGDRAILQLVARPAICKPRHRALAVASDACCGSAKDSSRATA